MSEVRLGLEEAEARKEQFLGHLAGFVIEAAEHGWAAGAPLVEDPQRPGFKELVYRRGEWEYRDSYAGYYQAPGSSVVYYGGRPVWYMTYGGEGQHPDRYDRAPETFDFLRRALLQPDPDLPVRGRSRYEEDGGRRAYFFGHEGSLARGKWRETVMLDGSWAFQQHGDVGLIIAIDEQQQPVLPWNLL